MKKSKKQKKDHTKSIGTPLGHIKVNSDIVDRPIIEQIKDLLHKDK